MRLSYLMEIPIYEDMVFVIKWGSKAALLNLLEVHVLYVVSTHQCHVEMFTIKLMSAMGFYFCMLVTSWVNA